MLMHDDLRGPDSVRNRMDSWHLERNQYLTTTLYQLETLMGQGGDLSPGAGTTWSHAEAWGEEADRSRAQLGRDRDWKSSLN